MKFYLEFNDESSHKFWCVQVRDNNIIVTYGKIGSDGKPSVKAFSSTADALKEARKQAKAKIKKGYADKTLEHFGNTERQQVTGQPADVVDDGLPKPWHSASYWDTWGINMDMSPEELRNPGPTKIKDRSTGNEGNEMPEEIVQGLQYQLEDYGREKKVRKVIETVNTLRTANIPPERMQKVLDRTLWSTFVSHWDVSEEHLEIMRILLGLGAALPPKLVKFVLSASEDEITKIDDREIRPPYSNHISLQNIGIFKRYMAAGSRPEKFMECVDNYFEELYTEAATIAERLLRKAVDIVKSGGDPDRKYPIPGGKFTPDINGLRVEITGDSILIYPDIFSFNAWTQEDFVKVDDINNATKNKRFSGPLTRTFNKLLDEGVFDGITNGKINLYIEDNKNVLVSRVIDPAAYEAVIRSVLSEVEELEASKDWEANAEQLKNALVPALNMGLETDGNRLLDVVLAHLYSGNPEAEEAAEKLLSDYKRMKPEWRYQYALYRYRNFDFKWAPDWMKELADEGYEPARKTYAEWLDEGTFTPPAPAPFDDDDDDDVKTTYSAQEMFVETDTVIARADSGGHIRVRFKVEGEKGYSDALDFINNLTFKGYSRKYNGLQFSIYFLAEPMSDYPAEAFFIKASQYPSLHEKLAFYVDSVMYGYDHYHDGDSEDNAVTGTYAAKQLILADPKNLPLAVKMADATDGEHEEHAYYFTYDVIRRYGITPESVPAIYELSLTCDHRDPDLPAEVYKNTANLEALINHVNASTHHFKGGKFLRFICGVFGEGYDYKGALAAIRKLYDAATGLKEKNIYADFYNLALNILADPNANPALRYGNGTAEQYGEPLQGVAADVSASTEERLGDQSCVITRKEAEARGLEYSDIFQCEGKSVVTFFYTAEPNPDIVQFHIAARDKQAYLDSKATYPRYAAYSNEPVGYFDQKWAVDMRRTAFRNGMIFYDGKNKPIVIYGILDSAEIVQRVGKKMLDAAALIQLRDRFTHFPSEEGACHIDHPANQYLCDAYRSAYKDKYHRASMDIEKVKPEDGKIHEAAQAFKTALMQIKKEMARKARIE